VSSYLEFFDREELKQIWQFTKDLRANRARIELGDRFTGNRPQIYNEFYGRLGEAAVAKYLGVEYRFDLNDNRTTRDVAGYEVRTTTRERLGLATYDHDHAAIYISTYVDELNPYEVLIRGWAYLEETRTPERWNDRLPYPAYVTPVRELRHLKTLPEATP
jgi:hypothetical protein